jgi:hypothetical protein
LRENLALVLIQRLAETQEVVNDVLLLLRVQRREFIQLCRNRFPIRLGSDHEIREHGAFLGQRLVQILQFDLEPVALELHVGQLVRAQIEPSVEHAMRPSAPVRARLPAMSVVGPDPEGRPHPHIERE